jgi:UTP:GlnB (protein PII) uridylyltransferase
MPTFDEELQAQEATPPRREPWPRLAALPGRLAAAGFAPDAFRRELAEANAELIERFRADESVETLVHARAELIDVILREVWRSQLPAGFDEWALAAVGGYGRGELHPHSDIDILILVPDAPDDAGRGVVERVVTFVWDINLGWARACAAWRNAPRKAPPMSAS